MKDLKYLCAYTIPLTAFLGIWLGGYFTYLTVIYAFGLIPLLELFTPSSTSNLDKETRHSKLNKRLFDWMLYINLPIIYIILFYALNIVTTTDFSLFELIGIILTTGIVLGSNGINVGHELGHRFTYERFIGKALLLPSLYMHFYIEHNFGHHLKVATKEDPATSKYNQTVYYFWITSCIGQYISAWRIQLNLLRQNNKHFFSIQNDMLWYIIITSLYLFFIYQLYELNGLLFVIMSGIVGFLLLETINYIEHYGLLRLKKSSGRYERVKEIHSWNSNHTLGRIMLYELTRHSDHHHRASKKYQILDHHDSSPQLPFGYPTSMVLSLFPPLWFMIMNKRVPREMKPSSKII